MKIVVYILLGIIQGLTEFLPVSSSAHLVLAEHWMKLNPHGVLLEIAFHVATLISVLLVFGKDIWNLFARRQWQYIGYLGFATLITAAIVLPLKDQISQLTDSSAAPRLCGAALLVTSAWLFAVDWRLRHPAPGGPAKMTWGKAALIGLAQAVSGMLRGFSRSGSTIGMGIFAGLERQEAARFSFMLSVPIIIGAALIDAKELPADIASGTIDPLGLALGFLAAMIMGVIAIRLLIWMLKSARLLYFSIYCAALAVVALIIG